MSEFTGKFQDSRGRAINARKSLSDFDPDKRYEGRACNVCGGKFRLLSNDNCVECAIRNNKKSHRKKVDKKHYGVSIDNDLVERRRAAEELKDADDWH